MSSVYPPQLTSYSISPSTGLMAPFNAVMDRPEQRTNTAVMADARDLIYPIGPNETIAWRCVFILGGNSAGDAQIGFYTPAAPVSGGFIATFVAPGAAAAVAFGGLASYNVSWAPLEDSTGAGDELINLFEGHLVNGVNGGYFSVQWAQNVANVAPSNLMAGSRLDVWKYAP